MTFPKSGPNPATIADGYSLSDERVPVIGPELDFDYERENETPIPDTPKLYQSHPGEHHGDFGEVPVQMSSQVYVWVLCAALNSCNLGYDIGVNTSAGPIMQQDLSLSEVELELFFGSINFFAMVGAIFAYAISDRFGRRHAFAVAAIHVICGTVIIAVSHSFYALIVGRVFVGLGVGFGLALDPLYIAEITPASRRGELVTWSEIAINVGILLGFSSGLIFGGLSDDISWRLMFGMGVIQPVLMIFLAKCVMVESPRWMVCQGKEDKAVQVLQKVYGDGYDVTPILLDMKEAIEREAVAGKTMGWDVILFPTPSFRRMLVVGIGIAVAQQAVGIDAIQYFLVYILRESGIDSRPAQMGILMFLGFIKLVFIIIGGKLFDRRGRRPLLFISLCGMALALIFLSVNFVGNSNSAVLTILGLGTYLAFFSLGLGPGAWLIPSEIFANCIRAKAMSIATFMNRMTATLMSSTFLSTANAMSWAGFFLLLACVCILILVFVYLYLPETKGRSLEDMSIYFAEITGDNKILDAEARIIREREAVALAQKNAPHFEPIKVRDTPPEKLRDAEVTGTMA
ncbi:major facilitator superfamily-like protein [Fragilaria crotonensis]|nr:major facilitator superfamily-like protein [Fragilaria crotonensis]